MKGDQSPGEEFACSICGKRCGNSEFEHVQPPLETPPLDYCLLITYHREISSPAFVLLPKSEVSREVKKEILSCLRQGQDTL